MIGRLNKTGGGGGVDIQGIIEKYLVNSSYNVSAGDFVQYIGTSVSGTDTELDGNISAGYSIAATKLNDTKVFVVSEANDGFNNYTLHGQVVTISGTTITTGTDTILQTGTASGEQIGENLSIVTLEENKVFIAYTKGSSKLNLYTMLCTISGTTITAGTEITINGENTYYSNPYIGMSLISNNKVFISYTGSYSLVCTISGTTVTTGTETRLTESSVDKLSIITLEENKVFIALSYMSHYLSGMVCTISGTTITKGTIAYNSSYSNTQYGISVTRLHKNKVFIAFSYNTSNVYLYGIVASINNNTVTFGSAYSISSNNYSGGRSISTGILIKYSQYCEVVIYYGSSNGYLYRTICTIKETSTTISVGTATTVLNNTNSGTKSSAIPILAGEYFIAHSRNNGYDLYGIVQKSYELMPYNGSNPLVGIAKTKGNGGEIIEVYQPD